jgi:hypothetical protein
MDLSWRIVHQNPDMPTVPAPDALGMGKGHRIQYDDEEFLDALDADTWRDVEDVVDAVGCTAETAHRRLDDLAYESAVRVRDAEGELVDLVPSSARRPAEFRLVPAGRRDVSTDGGATCPVCDGEHALDECTEHRERLQKESTQTPAARRLDPVIRD